MAKAEGHFRLSPPIHRSRCSEVDDICGRRQGAWNLPRLDATDRHCTTLLTSPMTMLLTAVFPLLAVLRPAAAYHEWIHPEYQEGLAIGDVPADRRIHWMRMANEVSYKSRSLLMRGNLRRWPSVSTGTVRDCHREQDVGRACVCHRQPCWCNWRYVTLL